MFRGSFQARVTYLEKVSTQKQKESKEYSLCVASAGNDVPIRVGELN
jgi:hypothetical protein